MSDWLSFFFFKQKTAYEMRISDWSSDVCSSDLALDDAPVGDVEAGDDANADGHLLPSRLREGPGEGLFRERIIVTCPPLTPPASGRGTGDRDRLSQIQPAAVEGPPGDPAPPSVGDILESRMNNVAPRDPDPPAPRNNDHPPQPPPTP